LNSPIHEILKKYWQYDQFRDLQEDIIQSVLVGKDTLALMPTGGGKSICFQVPAMVNEGLCLVISPLVALMKDQVENLKKRGISAAAVHASMSKREIDIMLENAANGQYKFLYLSPERIGTPIFIERVKRMSINLIAIDEAHCISQWGYDFRPAYLRILEVRKLLVNTPIIALTATATQDVAEDIQLQLAFRSKNIFIKSFKRDNLSYVVIESEAKLAKLLDILKKVPGTAVVYVRSRKKTKEIADFLRHNQIQADYYHAGIEASIRDIKQDAWSTNKCRVMVCTNAFGMGIDKPDVRVVIHMDIPENIESYYQEAGRAGRDGKKSYAVLLVHALDKIEGERRLKESLPSMQEIKEMYEQLFNYLQIGVGSGAGQTEEFIIEEFAARYGYAAVKALNILKILEQEELISITESFYNPSKVKFLVGSEAIYKMQVSNKNYEPLINALLRSYEGMFDEYTKIKESQLASILKSNIPDIKRALVNLKQHHYIDYIPENSSPKIYFVQHRYKANNLLLNSGAIERRRKNKIKQFDEMMYYCFTNYICRSTVLINYFGEKNSSDCGVCDVCLQKKKLGLAGEDYQKISQQIITELGIKPQNLQQLIAVLSTTKEDKLIESVQWLLECNKIERNDNGQFQLVSI